MKKMLCLSGIIMLLAALAWLPGCSSDDPTDPDGNGDDQGTLPVIPVPASPTDLLPNQSADRVVGMSGPLDDFTPMVTQLQMMMDDGSVTPFDVNRRITLACAGVRPENTSDLALADRSYLSARPRLLHERYWQKIKQVTLDPGTTYERAETITYGTSTTHEESREFSQTMGIEVSVGGGWGPFSASVTASYEQTDTVAELNSVTFSEESSYTETYSVEVNPDHTRVYAIWQLVDKFSFVDEDTVRFHQSPVLIYATLPEIADIVFPSMDVIYQSITEFD